MFPSAGAANHWFAVESPREILFRQTGLLPESFNACVASQEREFRSCQREPEPDGANACPRLEFFYRPVLVAESRKGQGILEMSVVTVALRRFGHEPLGFSPLPRLRVGIRKIAPTVGRAKNRDCLRVPPLAKPSPAETIAMEHKIRGQ